MWSNRYATMIETNLKSIQISKHQILYLKYMTFICYLEINKSGYKE